MVMLLLWSLTILYLSTGLLFLCSWSSLRFIQSLIDIHVHLSSLLSGYPYSFEWEAMPDVRVNRALVGNVLMDSVSFGCIFMSLGGFHSVIELALHTASFSSVLECSLAIIYWFQVCLTSSRVEYLMVNCRFLARLEDFSIDDSFSVVKIRGRLCNVDAAWDAKSRHCDIRGIFSGENTITLPNLCESRNHVSSALMAEAIAVRLAVATTVYSNILSLGVLSDSLSLIKLLKNGGFQPKLFVMHVV
ncbi:RNase H domain-containing protein [Raphanus sativus]|nr:RNase H domain-containing protein [Raphanus sativus]